MRVLTHEEPTRLDEPLSAQGDQSVVPWLVLATFVVILNETLLMNAVPRLMTAFSIGEEAASWLSTIFLLTMAAVMPTTGWLLHRFSPRTVTGGAMGLFWCGTLLAAMSPSFEVLLVARAVQAAGTAVMVPLLMTTVLSTVALADRGRVMGRVALAISVAPALGPPASGLVLDHASWRMLYVLQLPLAAAVAWICLRRLSRVAPAQAPALDWLSVLLAALGFAPVVFGLTRLGASGGFDLTGAGALAAGALSLAWFVRRQRALARTATPLLDLQTLSSRTFVRALALVSVAFLAMMGALLLIPLHLQRSLGLSEFEAGVALVPGGLLMGLLGPLVGRAMDRSGGHGLVLAGAAGLPLSLSGLAWVTAVAGPVWGVVLLHLAFMCSVALLFTPTITLGLNALPAGRYADGSSLLNTLQQVAGAVGIAMVGTVVASGGTAHTASSGSASSGIAFAMLAAAALLAVPCALMLIRRSSGSPGAPAREPRSV